MYLCFCQQPDKSDLGLEFPGWDLLNVLQFGSTNGDKAQRWEEGFENVRTP